MNDCHHDDHTSTAPFVAAFVALIIFGLIARYWIWALAIVGAVILFAVLLWLAFWAARGVDKRYAERAALVARADQQHAWILAGARRWVQPFCMGRRAF
jgi:uncharacterized membrane protein